MQDKPWMALCPFIPCCIECTLIIHTYIDPRREKEEVLCGPDEALLENHWGNSDKWQGKVFGLVTVLIKCFFTQQSLPVFLSKIFPVDMVSGLKSNYTVLKTLCRILYIMLKLHYKSMVLEYGYNQKNNNCKNNTSCVNVFSAQALIMTIPAQPKSPWDNSLEVSPHCADSSMPCSVASHGQGNERRGEGRRGLERRKKLVTGQRKGERERKGMSLRLSNPWSEKD